MQSLVIGPDDGESWWQRNLLADMSQLISHLKAIPIMTSALDFKSYRRADRCVNMATQLGMNSSISPKVQASSRLKVNATM